MTHKSTSTQARKEAKRIAREQADSAWLAVTSRAAELLNQQNFGDDDAPSLLTIAGIEFGVEEITVPVVSLRTVTLFDCGYGKRVKRRARRYELVTYPMSIKLKCKRIYNCWDPKTKTAFRVRIVRRTKYQGLGERYYKYERIAE